MIATFSSCSKNFHADLSAPLDISIPLRAGKHNVNAFHIPPAVFEPFSMGDFIGDVQAGGACNVYDVKFNPHGNGTHTETVGHISKEKYPIYAALTQFFFSARLITLAPIENAGDWFITAEQIAEQIGTDWPEALVIRTLPNSREKLNFQYSGTNPVFLHANAAALLCKNKVLHLLVDFPSVDREEDGGRLSAHKAFWNYPEATRKNATITELIFVPESILDGWYLLNLQTSSFDNDASPSKPVLFRAEII